MYGNLGPQRYREADISSMSREKILVLLYEKAIADIEDAAAALARDDRLTMNGKANHAMRIVTELRSALDHAAGGQIADNLDSLYDFVFRELLAFLVDRQPEHARNCTQVLTPLLDAWRQIPAGAAEAAAARAEAEAPKAGPIPAYPREAITGTGPRTAAEPSHESPPTQSGLLSVSA